MLWKKKAHRPYWEQMDKVHMPPPKTNSLIGVVVTKTIVETTIATANEAMSPTKVIIAVIAAKRTHATQTTIQRTPVVAVRMAKTTGMATTRTTKHEAQKLLHLITTPWYTAAVRVMVGLGGSSLILFRTFIPTKLTSHNVGSGWRTWRLPCSNNPIGFDGSMRLQSPNSTSVFATRIDDCCAAAGITPLLEDFEAHMLKSTKARHRSSSIHSGFRCFTTPCSFYSAYVAKYAVCERRDY